MNTYKNINNILLNWESIFSSSSNLVLTQKTVNLKSLSFLEIDPE